jgi:cysteine/O-acetylserine efflux protein
MDDGENRSVDQLMPDLVAFTSYVAIMTLTPGPNNMLCMVNGGQFGVRRSLGYLAGLYVGVFLVMLGGSLLSMSLERVIPGFRPIAQTLGGVYLLYLAVKLFRSGSGPKEREPKPVSFLTGLGMQFVNVKMLLYAVTVTANFVVPYFRSASGLVLMSLLLAACSATSGMVWIAFGAAVFRLFSSYRKPLNIAMGLLMLYAAASISGLLPKLMMLLNPTR